MRAAIDIDTGEWRTWAGQALTGLSFRRRDRFPVDVRFLRSGGVVELANGATGKLGIKATASGDFVAAALSWTKTGTGTSATYAFDLQLNTVELEALFAAEPASVSLIAEIESLQGTTRISSVTIPVSVTNDVVRGSEGEPTLATNPTPAIFILDDVPSHATDFFMFEGGVVPTTGVYQASDANYIYTIKHPWTAWRRAPIAEWE